MHQQTLLVYRYLAHDVEMEIIQFNSIQFYLYSAFYNLRTYTDNYTDVLRNRFYEAETQRLNPQEKLPLNRKKP